MNTTNANELNVNAVQLAAEVAVMLAAIKDDCAAAKINFDLADEAAERWEALALQAEAELLAAVPAKKWTLQKGRPEANGIKRPSVGTVCAALWEAVEAVGVAVCTPKDVRALAAQHEWNVNNSVIEFYNCRKFHGVVGRAVKAA